MKFSRYVTRVVLILCLSLLWLVTDSRAEEVHKGTFKIIIFANDVDGFFDEEGEFLNNTVWKVAKDTQVEIIFKFKGNMDPEEEEEHEIHMQVLRFEDGSKPEKKLVVKRLKPLKADHTEEVLKFTAGEFKEKILKIYCKTDCDGMDYMDNLRIEVD